MLTTLAEPPAPAAPVATAGPPERTWTRSDWKAAGILVALPSLLFTIAAAAGYPLITGDDLVQNYPLEALSGDILRHGHLPLYDAFLWAGTPLLGGTNAHALLPLTLLFAVLPSLAAWVVGEVVVLSAAAVGCQLFLRRTGCGTTAAALAGAGYGLGGFITSQVVHIDFAAAAAALPWMLVALHGLATRPAASRPRHALLLAATLAWICLCGSPDIVVDAALIGGAFFVHLLLQPLEADRRLLGRGRLCAWTLLGGGIGLAVGALQWAPSAAFVLVSQRAHPSLSFISSGSLKGGNFLELLVPHVLAGGLFGSRAFAGSYPLAEVDAYPGVLALAGLFAMLAAWRQPAAWRWRVWLVVCAAGLLLAAGDHTPLERVIGALPIVGDQRLPSRALIDFALAASLIGGYFIDSLLHAAPTRRQVVAGLVPLVAVLGVVTTTVVTRHPAGGALTAHPSTRWSLAGDAPYLLTSATLALAAAALLLFRGRLSVRGRTMAVVALVVVDLLCFNLNQSSLAPAYASSLSPSEHDDLTALAAGGRFLLLDPNLSDQASLDRLGAADLGVIAGLENAGGYSSLMWGPYAAATGTHTQDGASTGAIADGTFSSLGVRALLVLPPELGSGPPLLTADHPRGSGTGGHSSLPGEPPLAAAVTAGGWVEEGTVGGFLVFVDPSAAPTYELEGGGSVHALSSDSLTGAATVEVKAPRAGTLVRSVADIPGWRATVVHDGRSTPAPVERHGLVQAVAVPAGLSTVSFSYVAPGWRLGQLLALLGALAGAGLLLGPPLARLVRRRRLSVAGARCPAPQ